MRDYASDLPVYLELDLFEAGWNGAMSPYPGESVKQAAMRQLRASIVKKFSDYTNRKADDAALVKFLQINKQCEAFCRTDQQALTEAETIALGEAKGWIHRLMFPEGDTGNCVTTLWSIADNFGVGNGANIGVKGTSLISKLGLSDLSATSSCLQDLYRRAIASNPTWADVEFVRSRHRDSAIVQGSRLSFVPKTREISRTICTEPVLNMLFQKGIGITLEAALRRVSGIDLSVQPQKNRELARLGSMTGEFGTIDLSSASDSMSLTLVREFFPKQLVTWLERTRSPVTVLPDGRVIDLHMVSSMGNAYTFPLQTIFFCSLVYGAYRVKSIKFDRPFGQSLGNFAVFGDDIIVKKEVYDFLLRLLSICGFSVNVDKSFNTTDFRESCGLDFMNGHDIRGVYIKHLLDDGDKYSAINRLNNWSARHGIFLPNTIGFLRKGLRSLLVPFDEADTAGIKAPLELCKHRLRPSRNGGFSYRFLAVCQGRTYDLSDVMVRPPKMDGWFNNHSAVLLAAIAGTLRSGKVVDRTFRRSFRVKTSHTPRWDYVPSEYRASGAFVAGWKAIYELNLNFI